MVIATHMPAGASSHLMPILSRAGKLEVFVVRDGLELNESRIYVARPNHHVLIERDHLHLTHGPKENHVRPAINPMFRSAAHAYGSDTIGVILSGALDDGVAGLWEIKRRGGIAIVQSPEDALFPDMPSQALQNVSVDYSEPADQIAGRITSLVNLERGATSEFAEARGIPGKITCPECRGPMEQFTDGKIVEFRCRVDHRYSAESMLGAHAETEERTLWAAVVALEEGADLIEKVCANIPPDHRQQVAGEAIRKREMARVLRQALTKPNASDFV